MATNFITMDVIASEALMQLENRLVAANLLYRDKTSDFSSDRGYAVGNTVRIKTRPEYETKEFAGSTVDQDVRESNTDFVVEKHFDITIPYLSSDLAMNLDGISEQMIQPAMTSLAQKIDEYLLTKLWDARGLYANAAPLSTSALIADSRKTANEQQIDTVNRIGLIDSTLEANMLGQSEFTRFDHRGTDAMVALREADMGRLMGIDWFSSLNIDTASNTHTNGTAAGNTTDNTGGSLNLVGTSSLNIDALTGQLEAGDRISIAGVKRPLIVSTQTVATATAVPLSHPIDELIPDGAAVTITGGASAANVFRGVICTPDAFAYAIPPLEQPAGVEASVLSANGLSIRVVRDYTMSSKKNTISFDLLIGGVAYDPRKAMIISDI